MLPKKADTADGDEHATVDDLKGKPSASQSNSTTTSAATRTHDDSKSVDVGSVRDKKPQHDNSKHAPNDGNTDSGPAGG